MAISPHVRMQNIMGSHDQCFLSEFVTMGALRQAVLVEGSVQEAGLGGDQSTGAQHNEPPSLFEVMALFSCNLLRPIISLFVCG